MCDAECRGPATESYWPAPMPDSGSGDTSWCWGVMMVVRTGSSVWGKVARREVATDHLPSSYHWSLVPGGILSPVSLGHYSGTLVTSYQVIIILTYLHSPVIIRLVSLVILRALRPDLSETCTFSFLLNQLTVVVYFSSRFYSDDNSIEIHLTTKGEELMWDYNGSISTN